MTTPAHNPDCDRPYQLWKYCGALGSVAPISCTPSGLRFTKNNKPYVGPQVISEMTAVIITSQAINKMMGRHINYPLPIKEW